MKRCTLIFCLIFIFPLISPVYAASKITPKPNVSPVFKESKDTATNQATIHTTPIQKQDDYQLPYPGILPDHPLYFLKRFRDGILDALIVDPIRKAEFYVLQADKRLVMGMVLFDKNNNVLGEQVISRAEKYMSQAVSSLQTAKTAGRDLPGYIMDKMEHAMGKHMEVIQTIQAKAVDAQKPGLLDSIKLIQRLQTDVGKLK